MRASAATAAAVAAVCSSMHELYCRQPKRFRVTQKVGADCRPPMELAAVEVSESVLAARLGEVEAASLQRAGEGVGMGRYRAAETGGAGGS